MEKESAARWGWGQKTEGRQNNCSSPGVLKNFWHTLLYSPTQNVQTETQSNRGLISLQQSYLALTCPGSQRDRTLTLPTSSRPSPCTCSTHGQPSCISPPTAPVKKAIARLLGIPPSVLTQEKLREPSATPSDLSKKSAALQPSLRPSTPTTPNDSPPHNQTSVPLSLPKCGLGIVPLPESQSGRPRTPAQPPPPPSPHSKPLAASRPPSAAPPRSPR